MGAKIESVLLVDDEADIRMVGELSLRAVGKLRVFVAASGDEALAVARRERPDVVVLDVMMPGMDGLATFEALKADAVTRELPVVFLTASVQRAEVDEYLRRGARGVIAKPFDPMTLASELRRIMDD